MKENPMLPLIRPMLLAALLCAFVACTSPKPEKPITTVSTDIQAEIEAGSGEDFDLSDKTTDLAPTTNSGGNFTLRLSFTRKPTLDNNVPYRAHAKLTWSGSSPLKGNLKLVVRRKQNTIPVNTSNTALTLVKNKSQTVDSGLVKVSPSTLLCVDAIFTRTAQISTKTIGHTVSYCLSPSGDDKVAPKVTLSAGQKSLTAQAIRTIQVMAPGKLNFTAIATDNVSIRKVQLLERGMVKAQSSSSPLNASIDYVATDVGTYWYLAKAYDAAGNVGSSELVKVEVTAQVTDATPPMVTLTAQVVNPSGTPGLQTTVATDTLTLSVVAPGSVNFTATATDDSGIKNIQLLEGGILKAETNSSPLSKKIDYTMTAVGTHTYFAKAFDAAGNVGSSGTVVVKVSQAFNTQTPIAYISYDPYETNNVPNVSIIPAGSTNPTKNVVALGFPENFLFSAPSWDPSCHKFAIVTYEPLDSLYALEIRNADGSGRTGIIGQSHDTNIEHYDITPQNVRWSPDGLKLGFSSQGHFYTIHPDRTGLEQSNIDLNSFDWSPDSQKIVYSDGTGVFTIDLNGGSPTKIASSGNYPRWSRLNQIIYVATATDKSSTIHVMNIGGSNNHVISQGTEGDFDYGPSWSPDGTKIAFSHISYPTLGDLNYYIRKVWMMDADGTNRIQLSPTNATNEFGPDWCLGPV
jgi:hypothetical protein